MSLPGFGSFKVHINEGLEVDDEDNRGFTARRSENPIFECKSLKEA